MKYGVPLVLLALVLAGYYFYMRVDEEIRVHVESLLAKRYEGLAVHVRSARLVEGEGIEVRGVSISNPRLDSLSGELVYVDEMRMSCATHVTDLVQGAPVISKLMLRGLRVRVTRLRDGRYSTEGLLPPPSRGGPSPKVVVQQGQFELIDQGKATASAYVLRDVNLTIDPPLNGGLYRVQGAISGDFIRGLRFSGEIDPERPLVHCAGNLEGLEVSPELRAALPTEVAKHLEVLAGFRGRTDVCFQLDHDPEAGKPWQFEVTGQLARGHLDHPKLPFPLGNIEAELTCNNEGLKLHRLSARGSDATIEVQGSWSGLSPASPGQLLVTVNRMPVDQRLHAVLPDHVSAFWDKFLPGGYVDLEGELTFDGTRWIPRAKVTCRDVEFTYYKFPYRLKRARGTIHLDDQVLHLDLTAFTGTQALAITGKVIEPGPDAALSMHLTGEKLPYDEALIAAMPDDIGRVLREINGRGTFNLVADIKKDKPGDPIHSQVQLSLNRASVRYEKFQYPVYDVTGTLHGQGTKIAEDPTRWRWSFENLVGRNASGQISCMGSLLPQDEGGLRLEFVGQALRLDSELRSALPERLRRVWDVVRPQGQINAVSSVQYLKGRPPVISVRLEPVGASMEPVHFPYRLDKLAGRVIYENGKVEWQRLRAQHGPVKMSSSGVGGLLSNGGWQLDFSELTADRLQFDRDRELVQALPPALRKVIQSLKPVGPVSLHGSLQLTGDPRPDVPVRSTWNLNLELQRVSVDVGVRLDGAFGTVSTSGEFDGTNYRTQGDLQLESIEFRGFQFSQIQGPFWADNKQVMLGSYHALREGSQGRPIPPGERRLKAQVTGGMVVGDCQVVLDQPPRFLLQASLSDGDLARYAGEMLAGRQKLKGRVNAYLMLGATADGSHTFKGHGRAVLQDADIYELPVMVALLKILSLRPPDTRAFSHSDLDFRVEGPYFYFDRIGFRGDAVSLRGNGSMNLDSEIHLKFYTVVGRDEFRVPLLDQVLGGASQELLEISVTGLLNDPHTSIRTLPNLTETLQQVFGQPATKK